MASSSPSAKLIPSDGGKKKLPDPVGKVTFFSRKVYIPTKEFPDFNFFGRIVGPCGMTVKELEQETGCKIWVCGKGSVLDSKKEKINSSHRFWQHLKDELHVLIQCKDTPNRAKIQISDAVAKVKEILLLAVSGSDELMRKQFAELALINGTCEMPPIFVSVSKCGLYEGISKQGIQGLLQEIRALSSQTVKLIPSDEGKNKLPDPVGKVALFLQKVYIPTKEFPDFNFVGPIVGPRGMTVKELEQETGCKIWVCGKGSVLDSKKEEIKSGKRYWQDLKDELHVLIQCNDTSNRAKIQISDAVAKVKEILLQAVDKLMRKQLAVIHRTFNMPFIFVPGSKCGFCEGIAKQGNQAGPEAGADHDYAECRALTGKTRRRMVDRAGCCKLCLGAHLSENCDKKDQTTCFACGRTTHNTALCMTEPWLGCMKKPRLPEPKAAGTITESDEFSDSGVSSITGSSVTSGSSASPASNDDS
ncbi:hypothetical protein L596_016348 [Steinernema carpocapsae]|uniref:K Homology domain-containing protein n=1 Tax=Steinernema carpocapsae TaxID=34508 RepID=A0A4U5NHU6_STECR|nr:hypothetical protein L596_016348 [Steinernema carpocapsae]